MTLLLENEILVVAATELELCGHPGLVCGVGPVEAAATISRELGVNQPRAVINVGIGGSRGLTPGTVVVGSEAFYCDLDAEIEIVDRVQADPELVAEVQAALPEAVVLPIATSAYVTGSHRGDPDVPRRGNGRVRGAPRVRARRHPRCRGASDLERHRRGKPRAVDDEAGSRGARRSHAAAARRRRRSALAIGDGAGSVHAPRAATPASAGRANSRPARRRGDQGLRAELLEGARDRRSGRAGERPRVVGAATRARCCWPRRAPC